MEYIIYCDESVSKGKFYSDFYGGALVRSQDFIPINEALKAKKDELHFKGEIKWTKVSEQYLGKYKEIISFFFNYIKEDKIKIRIMFRHNAQVPILKEGDKKSGYEKLYYQFIKHAFGLRYSAKKEETYLRLYFDILPINKFKKEVFINNIYALQSFIPFQEGNIKIRRSDIAEVQSHDHAILQCMDIILGAMSFRLNDQHKVKPEGLRIRGKKTIAKEILYKHINAHIREIYPGFNIGITTSKIPPIKIWELPYRHWKFTPREFVLDESKYK